MEYATIVVLPADSQEIGPETAEEMTQRIQDLHSMYDRLNEQLQTVQSSSEMQRILQERLVEQVHELDDLISNNKSQLYTELQVLIGYLDGSQVGRSN